MTVNKANGKKAATIAYLTIIGTIIAYFINFDSKNKFAYFHIRQALGLYLTLLLIGYFVGYFDTWMISVPFYLFFIILWFYGFLSALNGTVKPVPLVGEFYQKTFSIIGESDTTPN